MIGCIKTGYLEFLIIFGCQMEQYPILDSLDFLLYCEQQEENEPMELKTVVVNMFTDWANTAILREQPDLSLDMETTALKPYEGKIRLIQTYLPTIDQVAVIDLWNPTTEQLIWLNVLLDVLADPSIVKYCQNGMFDFYWIYWKFKVLARNLIDTRLLSQIEKAGQYEGYLFSKPSVQSPNSLEFLSLEHGYDHDKSQQSSDWGKLFLSPAQISYAARDAIVTYKIGKDLITQLMEDQPDVVMAECGSIPAFVWLQYNGLVCDVQTLNHLLESYSNKSRMAHKALEKLMPYDPNYHLKVVARQAELDQLAASGIRTRKAPFKEKPFNVSSSSQVLAYLKSCGYSEELIKEEKGTGIKKESSGKDVLFLLSAENPDHVELKEIALYRGVAKAASTLKSYRESYDPFRKCIDTSYSVLAVQGMGRSSSGEKGSKAQNCQNVSKFLPSHEYYGLDPIRTFMKPRDGYVLAEIDLDASHAQFARYLSQDTNLQRAKNEGIKLHYFTLSSMLAFEGKHYSPEDCILLCEGKIDSGNHSTYKRLYKLSKNVFYSFLNYSGGGTLQATFFKGEMFVSLEDCKKYLQACADAFCELRQFQDQVYSNAMKTKHRLSSRLGHVLGDYVISHPCDGSTLYHRGTYHYNTNTGYRETKWKISDIISGQWLRPEATVMKTALRQVTDFRFDTDLDFRLINFSHDSFILEIHKSVLEDVLPHCFEIVNASMRRYIPDYEPEAGWESCIKKESWEK